jgi:3-hydroxyacyl-CoA dehydrogenase
MRRFQIRKVAVLGAGVMGAQIAAHLVNVKVPVVLFDLAAKEGPKNGIVNKAVDNLKKLKPAPLAVPEDAALITRANYDEHLQQIAECDLIIEAVAERMDWKHDLYQKIAPFVAPHAIVASNTSGLSIAQLSEALPQALRPQFCGIHFFNPPRYMHLVELIPAPQTRPELLDQLETFVTSGLGKGVIRAKDTSGFVANRIGVALMLFAIQQAEKFGLTYDVVDDLTGTRLGRSSSGTFRTADVVGLDTTAHVIQTMRANLQGDPFFERYVVPPALAALVERGSLGQKSGAGFYKKAGKDILRYDPATSDYRPADAKAEREVQEILRLPATERLTLLRNSNHPQAQFLWAILRDGFHYAAIHLAGIAESARDIDLALRWGFGMKQGIFELWQEAGWKQVAEWVQADIDAGKALSTAPLPAWVFGGPVANSSAVHGPSGSWSAARGEYVADSALPVYQRQLFPERVEGATASDPLKAGVEEFRSEAVRAWTLDGNVLIASITTKRQLIGPGVTQGLLAALEIAEAKYEGLVIWSPGDAFSGGGDLEMLTQAFREEGVAAVAAEERKRQDLMQRLRYAAVPVVAAVKGLALGSGCELAIHCARRVVATESYLGLPEVGLGLIPSAGGIAYFARRAAERVAGTGADLLGFLKEGFGAIATAKVGTSALDSRKLGYLLDSDVIVPHPGELLHVAIAQARALYDSGYRAPDKYLIPVAGRSGVATVKAQLVGLRDGGFISLYDFQVSSQIAEVICGGEIEAGTLVTEAYLMKLEHNRFCSLLEQPKTQARILSLLQTGRPVRN